jgi:Asp-tRNA(Asn)/Glu-tRNA(Gln) amidotransferase A subunit family amidase
MTNDDLCYLTAGEALGLFERRELSPLELMRALIDRSEKVNPKINCWSERYFDEALAKAKAAEARYIKASPRPRPLEGVPIAVKDAQRVNGRRTTQGSLILKDHVDDRSDPMIERLEKAGAIIHARTTTPEFCLSGVCHSRIWGVTRNPWNLEYGPGGSSGGSGAALAAGLTPLATGTDIGGSIRIPASACGVVGFKPPHGRNPDGPPANLDRFNHCGPMTRSIADAALMQSITAGPHPLDHDSLRGRVRLPDKAGAIKGLKIAWSADLGYMQVEEEVRRNMLAALDVLRARGAVTEEVALGWTGEIEKAAMHWYNTMHFGRQTVWWKKTHAGLMTDYALKLAEAIEKTTGIDDVHKAFEAAHLMYQAIGPVLQSHDVFICPTLAVPAVLAEHDPWDEDFRINGIKVDPEYGWVLTHHFNMLHNCPVISVPSGFASNGVPTGIQIVGRTFEDGRVFRAALAYEAASGGWYREPASRPVL